MGILKSKEIAKMKIPEIDEKVKELRNEMLKAKAANKKGGKSNLKEIKRTIARLLTFRRMHEKTQVNKTEAKK